MSELGLFSKRRSSAGDLEQVRARERLEKDRRDAILRPIDAWLEALEEQRAPQSAELTDDLLAAVGGVPMPVAASAQEANHSRFISDYAMARSYTSRLVENKDVQLTLQTRDARLAGDGKVVTDLEARAAFWSSVQAYVSRL